ncbi:DASH complex subunit Ask1-domain-containing protein [Mycena filopes]|nr:DASH complex subunit Ask1-domain-containing protein [Mycena filopes]
MAPLLDQIEQMEQLITIKLQNVDENFAKIHSIPANKILPAVMRYAVGTKPVKEAANFWVSFYEQAAQIRIPTFDDHSTDYSMASTENSFMPGQTAFTSTPATARAGHTMSTDDPSWSASLESPLARLDREVQNFSLEDSSVDSKLPSLRFNDPSEVDDDTIIRPRVDKGKGKESAEPLLRNVLRNTLTSDPSFSTLSPTKGKLKTPVPNGLNPYLPPDTTPANWSGLVDLRHTPLSTPLRKKHGGYDKSDDDSFDGLPAGMSPPVLMSPAKPPRSSAELQLVRGKTPAKVAASRIKNDLVRDIQRQNSAKARKVHGYAMSGGESSMSTVSSPPSLSRYNRHDTDKSAGDTSLESVTHPVVLIPPTWTPAASAQGSACAPKHRPFAPSPSPRPTTSCHKHNTSTRPRRRHRVQPATPQHYDDFDSDSNSRERNEH